MNSDQPQAKIPETRFHQVTIKVGERDQMPFMLHEEIGTGTQGDREITVARSVNSKLLFVALGKSNYIIDVGDIVQGLIEYEDASK